MEKEKQAKFNRKFMAAPKSTQYLLNFAQQGLLTYLIEYQDFKKNEEFEIGYGYIATELGISKTTSEKLINELIDYDFLIKIKSGSDTRKLNIYSINNDELDKYDKLTKREIIEIREQNKKNKK